MNYNKKFGKQGEDIAVEYLESQGFEIIIQNYQFSRYGEIDIVAYNNNLLLFVEVKNRNSIKYGAPQYSITNKKKKSLRNTANAFLNSHERFNNKSTTCRFDMIAIVNNNIEWIQDIIR